MIRLCASHVLRNIEVQSPLGSSPLLTHDFAIERSAFLTPLFLTEALITSSLILLALDEVRCKARGVAMFRPC